MGPKRQTHTKKLETTKKPQSTLGNKIKCPICNKTWLHKTAYTIYKNNKRIQIDENGIKIDEKTKENPSPRRDSIIIEFFCENCNIEPTKENFKLKITQHKGEEFTTWENIDEEKQKDNRKNPQQTPKKQPNKTKKIKPETIAELSDQSIEALLELSEKGVKQIKTKEQQRPYEELKRHNIVENPKTISNREKYFLLYDYILIDFTVGDIDE